MSLILKPRVFKDMLGRELRIDAKPKRIISLVPSQTELLFDLGLNEEVVGITRFCLHPNHWFQSKTRIGGTKEKNPSRILELQPDLVIANKEENERELISILELNVPVWVSDVKNPDDCIKMIKGVGEITSSHELAEQIVYDTEQTFKELKGVNNPLRVLYLIWYDPWMSIGHDTYIHSLLHHMGYKNVLHAENIRYPKLSAEEIVDLNPEIVFLSSEPFPFKVDQSRILKLLLPNARIEFVDGEAFSWYGTRILKKQNYFHELAISTKIQR